MLLFAVALMVSVPVALAAQFPDTRPLADDAQLREALDEIRQRHDVPGLAAAVFDGETLRVFGVGELTPGGDPVTPQSRFRTGQASLLFTALAAAALGADGSLPPDGEVRRLAPEIDLHNPWSTERPVRVADLLTHRAGLGATHFRDVYSELPDQPLLAGINGAFRALRLEHRPGERERYSVAGPAITAYLVEKAAETPYERVLERLLFEPLSLAARLGRPSGGLPGDSLGHAGWPARSLSPSPLNFPPAGDVWISAEDFARVGQLLLNRGRSGDRQILPASAIDWIESAPVDDVALVPGSRHGVRAEDAGGIPFFTQTGALPGFLARVAYSPALGRGYLVLLNHGDARTALTDADALLRGQVIGDIAVAPPVPAAAPPESLAGWYRDVSPESPPRRLYQAFLGFARAWNCDDGLCFDRPDAAPVVLEAAGENRLRARGHWQPGWEIRATENGHRLEEQGSSWQPVSAARVFWTRATAIIVLAGLLFGVALLPSWCWSLTRRRVTDYRELLPRLLPLAAVLSVLAGQWLLFAVDYPALGRASGATIAILVFTLLAPLLAALALPAAVAGFFWGLPRRTAAASLFMALAAAGAVVALVTADLIVFQTWNY